MGATHAERLLMWANPQIETVAATAPVCPHCAGGMDFLGIKPGSVLAKPTYGPKSINLYLLGRGASASAGAA